MCMLHNCKLVDKNICYCFVVDSILKDARQKTSIRKTVPEFSVKPAGAV
jgi:hypothetical protein